MHNAAAKSIPSQLRATHLDRASVRGPALLSPHDGIRGFGRPISLRVIRSGAFTGGVSDWPVPPSRSRSCGVKLNLAPIMRQLIPVSLLRSQDRP